MNTQGANEIDVLLAESFKKLARTRPIEKITIREITDEAGVIRPTFYNHFQDKYELLEWIIKRELIDPIEPLLDNGMLKEALILPLTTMEKDKAFYTRAVNLEGQNSFSETLKKSIAEMALSRLNRKKIDELLPYKDWLTAERVADYFSATLCYAVIEWVKGDMRVPMNELVDIFIYVASHSLTDIISNLYQ
ncbi:MAG: TetR/AcrR family transcriptional regulator C-terminal domain-containing protein [Lachnospiraceae bacterium]|nr:TetR/AcrR family transcriptional regulator C-terminal domain-containing protein [Lachnospiraceae bacterium]MDD7327363.1 TetR/AcrR family transcriptional regulator C-terminal domain-containing protein [Lachnospiraceae bacterium]MDY2759660.1 TetR/AcrR family transcriptional regulator C-terminal domain-containing protein [Lachnospiraceae bacterium]